MGWAVGRFYGKPVWVKFWVAYIFAYFPPTVGFMGAENDFELPSPPLRLIIVNHIFLKQFCTHKRKNCIENSRKSL